MPFTLTSSLSLLIVVNETWNPPVTLQVSELSQVICVIAVLDNSGVAMFARTVTVNLKANSAAEFTRTLENQIIPLLRKQKGFQDEITLLGQQGNEAVAISFWNQTQDADAYEREVYPEVLKALAKIVDGTPRVGSHEVSNSTVHKIAARVAA